MTGAHPGEASRLFLAESWTRFNGASEPVLAPPRDGKGDAVG